jgi:hypothetical protein
VKLGFTLYKGQTSATCNDGIYERSFIVLTSSSNHTTSQLDSDLLYLSSVSLLRPDAHLRSVKPYHNSTLKPSGHLSLQGHEELIRLAVE